MAFDFKKEYRALYAPKPRPELVTVPAANYIAVRGKGDPNEADGAYQPSRASLIMWFHRWRASGGRTVWTGWITPTRAGFTGPR